MAKDFTIRNEFFCDEDTFWEGVFLTEDFNRRLFLEVLKFPSWTATVKESGAGASKKIERIMNVVPRVGDLPAPLKKVMGDRFGYEETGTYEAATRKYAFTTKTSTMADKVHVHGSLHTEKLGDKHIARVAKVHVEVKIFMVGALAEEKFISDLRTSYETAARFTETYLKEKSLWTPPG
ncbi:DUF2505 family protein [Pendulispora albinea]|uniref:DUF2505 domain-containing protein n=1 Tax=Pendulispora albinea TaxID=2741071 RepID=A0ABZ2LZJ7_9BACT